MQIKVLSSTPKEIDQLIFNLLDIFDAIGIPVEWTNRKLERMAKACLAVGQIKQSFIDAISSEESVFSRSRDIMAFENQYYGENIADSSYDDIRRQDLKLLVEAGIVINSASQEEQATNNPSRGYALSPAFKKLLPNYGTPNWESTLNNLLMKRHL